MKSIIRIVFISFCFLSCKTSELEKEFSCSSEAFNGTTEKVNDVKNKFSIHLPKHWKTNLFYDETQSSIYTADTIKQLTETVLIDVTHIQSSHPFDAYFKKQLTLNDSIQLLTNDHQKQFQYKNKTAYYSISSGRKGNFPYQILNLFVNQNENSSFHFKTEIYGDFERNKRFCKALNTFNSISFNEP